jgi:nicotinamidase-related amidase
MRSRKHAQTCPSPVPVALLLIDVLTTFQFPDGDAILQGALGIRDALVRLKARARTSRIPVLYVNDNFGDWRSEKEVLMGRCLEAKGAQFVRPLLPDSEDYFVLKPMHSAFYMTPLEVLLQHLQVETLILTGLTSNSCITVTAQDANMRGLISTFRRIAPARAMRKNTRKRWHNWMRWLGLTSYVRFR